MTIIINNTEMNITDKIIELEDELDNQYRIKESALIRIKELKTQIKKLRTISKHAEEVLGNKVEENGKPVLIDSKEFITKPY